MKVGISITSAFRVDDVRDGARQMIDRARAAHDAGLASLFVGDHHVTGAPYYQNTPIMGRLLAEWGTQPAGVLMLLPLWHPVLLAEQVATLATIADGPFILQCGLGRGAGVFRAMSADIRFRPSAFEQSLDAIRRLWRGETVSLAGRWQFEEARISPVPPAPIDVWIGASAPPAIDRAARLGDAWLADPALTMRAAAESMTHYRNCLATHGRPTPPTIAIRRDIYVAASAADAKATRDAVAAHGYRGFDPEALVIGEPGDVAAQFTALAALGFTDVIVRNLHPDAQKAVDSTARLANVIAHLG